MRPPFYVRQLKRDLDDWIARGWVPATSRDMILGSVGGLGGRTSLAGVIATLGAVLLAAGAISFVAANWEAMSKILRLGVIFGALTLTYLLAALLFLRQMPHFAQAAILFGIAMFGAGLMLIGQTYHMNAGWPDGLMIWTLAAFAAAVIVPSRTALAAAIILTGVWTYFWLEDYGFARIHWAGLLALVAAFALAGWRQASAEVHLAFVALIVWLIWHAGILSDALGWSSAEVTAIYGLGALMVFLAGRVSNDTGFAYAHDLQRYGIAVTGIAVFCLHFTDLDGDTLISENWLVIAISAVLLAVLLARMAGARRQLLTSEEFAITGIATGIAAYPILLSHMGGALDLEMIYIVFAGLFIVWVIVHATRVEDRVIANLAFLTFGAWVIYLYTDVFQVLLDQATFFLIGGVMLVGLAILLEFVRRRVTAAEGG
ncbi:MAG: DUF2157 domain-containing protein [Alphaproteobacteria bacterium]|nr:DUF2157 domain-containing protein [Alphaproteobacteria bacterium]